MITTSLMAVLSSAVIAVSAAPNAPAWQTDYRSAMEKAAELKKPLVVFIGHGANAVSSVVTEGELGEVQTKLAEGYVPLYINVETESGKKLASAFEITEGVVISDRTGTVQAVLHDGKVSKSELNDYLVRYSDSNRVVTTTELGGRRRPVITMLQNVSGIISGNSYCPNCRR